MRKSLIKFVEVIDIYSRKDHRQRIVYVGSSEKEVRNRIKRQLDKRKRINENRSHPRRMLITQTPTGSEIFYDNRYIKLSVYPIKITFP